MASMDELKKAAGVRAADMIKDGMTVGLGREALLPIW